MFGWVSLQALRWHSPFPPPWHAAQALQKTSPQKIEQEIDYWNHLLTQFEDEAQEQQRAWAHYKIAESYWLKSYLQTSQVEQKAFLELSMQEIREALNLTPKNAFLIYALADLHHQLRHYDTAEEFYQEALKIQPDHELAQRRYAELKEEMKRK